MHATYAARLKSAREHAGLSQSDLARKLGLNVRPQTIQYLEDEKKAAEGSQYTASLARACGVDAVWLERGIGEMISGREPREIGASFEFVSDRAIAKILHMLKPEIRRAVLQIISALSIGDGARTFIISAGEQSRKSDRKKAPQISRAA